MAETDRRNPLKNHPTPPELQAFVSGHLSVSDSDRIADHLTSCDSCCQHLQETQDGRLIALARSMRTDALSATIVDPNAGAEQNSGHGAQTRTKILSATDRPDSSTEFATEGNGDWEVPEELRRHPRYEVLNIIGKGGMGVVYRARHRIMERQVALKVISNRFTSNQLAVERFQQEVRAAARLSHPCIVTAYDAEQAGSLHFLVMEFIEGKSLAQIVAERGPLPVREAVDLIRQASRGLQHAHDQKMIHRDIKPQNLMVTASGQLKILDFGLARLATLTESVSQTAATAMNLTAVGMVLGTPDFMSPEQAIDATSVDARSDIYSLGCTLFYLLSASSPFGAGSFSEMLQTALRRSPAALTLLRKDVPPPLLRILDRMIADAPEMRFQSAIQVAEALDALEQPELSAKTSAQESATSPQKSQSALTAAPVQTERSEQQPARHRRQRRTPKRSGRTDRLEGTGKAPATRTRTSLTIHIKAALVRHRILWSCVMALMTAAVIIPAVWPTGDRLLNQNVTVVPVIPTAPGEDGSRTSAVARQQSTVPQRQRQPRETAATQNAGKKSVADLHTIPRILMLIPNREFRWADRVPFDTLANQGIIELTTTSWSATVAGANPSERPMPVDFLLRDVIPGDYDAIVVNGGRQLYDLTYPGALHDDAGRIIRQMWSDGKLVVGISAGPGVLASLELLDTVEATGHPLIHEDVRTRFGVELSSVPVIRSGQFITVRDNAAIPELLRELHAALDVNGSQASP